MLPWIVEVAEGTNEMLAERIARATYYGTWDCGVWSWAPIVLLIASIWVMRREYWAVKLTAWLLVALATFLLVLEMAVSESLRDGLGPDSVESFGEEAVARMQGGLASALGEYEKLVGLGLLVFFAGRLVRAWRTKCPSWGRERSG